MLQEIKYLISFILALPPVIMCIYIVVHSIYFCKIGDSINILNREDWDKWQRTRANYYKKVTPIHVILNIYCFVILIVTMWLKGV